MFPLVSPGSRIKQRILKTYHFQLIIIFVFQGSLQLSYFIYLLKAIPVQSYIKTNKKEMLLSDIDFYHSHWEDVYNHFLCVRVHFSYINNNQWYLSFNLAGGYYTSKPTIHYITESHHDPQTRLLTFYKTEYFKAIINGFLTMPGVQLQ